MAKSTPLLSGPSRTHVRDIFADPPTIHESSSGWPNTHNTTQTGGEDDNSKTNELKPPTDKTTNGDVFFAEKRTMKSSAPESRVEKGGRRLALNSANKRPAPKPPSKASGTERTASDRRQGERSPDTAGHQHQQQQQPRHLVVGRLGKTTITDEIGKECGENESNLIADEHRPTGRGHIAAERLVTADQQRSGRAFTGRSGADVDYPEDNVTSVSVLSDSGTASSTSGYYSDTPDLIHRTPLVMRSQSPVPERRRDEEAFEEDECVLDFDEEDEDIERVSDDGGPARHTLIYKEYTGEDFSRYLEDDQESGLEHTPLPPPRKSRYTKRNSAPVTQPSTVNGSYPDNEQKKGFKQKIGQIFTLSRQHKNVFASYPGSKTSIQNFSFADSKMGEHLAADDDLEHLDSTLSDVGLRQNWSGTDTLAVRTLRRHSEVKTRPKRSSSVGDILDQRNPEFREDFESRRKSQMYDSKLLEKGQKKAGFWSKLGKSRKKKAKSKYEFDNTTDNPLIKGYTDKTEASSDVQL